MSLEVTAPADAARAPSAGIHLEPYAINLGAVVSGVDLGQRLSAGTRAALQQALRAHGVLFFRDQQLDSESVLEAARIFGEPLRHNPYLPSAERTSGVEIIESGTGKRLANLPQTRHNGIVMSTHRC